MDDEVRHWRVNRIVRRSGKEKREEVTGRKKRNMVSCKRTERERVKRNR